MFNQYPEVNQSSKRHQDFLNFVKAYKKKDRK